MQRSCQIGRDGNLDRIRFPDLQRRMQGAANLQNIVGGRGISVNEKWSGPCNGFKFPEAGFKNHNRGGRRSLFQHGP
jgi:hypothetical protein